MATPAQAAAATVGAGSLAAAGAYGITQAVNGSGEETTTEETNEAPDNEMPAEVTTFNDNESFSDTSYNTKLITLIKTTNLPHLVKPENNEKWWDWAFTNKYSKLKEGKQAHTVFASVTNSETLKTACQQAYTQNKTEYKFGEEDYLLKNISDYCTKGAVSIDISEPKAIVFQTANQTSGYTNGVTSVQENAAILVKKEKTNDNEYWWNWAFKNLYKAAEHTNDDNFKEITKGYSEDSESTVKSLNKKCDEAYKKGYSNLNSSDKALLKKIKKLCSTDRTETELVLPEPSTVDIVTSNDATHKDQVLYKANTDKLVDPAKSKDWWDWAYTNRFLKEKNKQGVTLIAPFNDAKITKGFEDTSTGGTSNITSLNKACKEAYGKDKETLKKPETGDSLINQIQKFCVPTSKGDLTAPA